jgi:poly(A) polymerase
MTSLPPLVERVRDALPATEIYLVGGAVRDLMLNRPVVDFDFVLAAKAIASARKVANALDADFYLLDESRDAARVLVTEGERKIKLDFISFQGAELNADLVARDLTINAMALSLAEPDRLVDPTGGAADLRTRTVRSASPSSFASDPVRILRAVRMAVSFGFSFEKQTLALMRASIPGLAQVSPERMRGEIFRLLELPKLPTALRILDQIGALSAVLPELAALKGVTQSPPHIYDVFEHTLRVVEKLWLAISVLGKSYSTEGASEFSSGIIVLRLGRYRSQLSDLLPSEIVPERTRLSLLMFAALFHDTGKPATHSVDPDGRIRFFAHEDASVDLVKARALALHLSNAEIDYLQAVVRHHGRPYALTLTGELPSRRAIHRFFSDTGAEGVDICLLSLADFMGKFGPEIPEAEFKAHLETLRTLLEAYYEKPQEAVSPPALVNGDDLISQLGIQPGPKLDEMLAAIREAQAAGEVNTADEAFSFARRFL